MAMSTLALFLVFLWRAKASSNVTIISTTSSEPHGEDNDDAHDWNVGLALLASFSFMMLLLYATNWKDPDIRRYTNEIICSTVGIFCAVLTFQTANGAIEQLGLEPGDEILEVVIRGAIVFILYAMMQLITYYFSNMLMPDDKYNAATSDKTFAAFMFHTKLNLATACSFSAHVTGFANIAMWVHLHEKEYFKEAWQHDAFIPLLALVWISSLRWLFKLVRFCLYRRMGSIQENQKERIKQWLENARDAETDVTGLSLSFLIVHILRIAVGGAHLNAEGREEWDTMKNHSFSQMVILFGFGIGFAGLAWAFLAYGNCRGLLEVDSSSSSEVEEVSPRSPLTSLERGTGERMQPILANACTRDWRDFCQDEGSWRTRAIESAVLVSGMCFAWCTYSSTNWLFSSGRFHVFKKTSCGMAISHALFLTILSFGGLRFVDYVDDQIRAESRRRKSRNNAPENASRCPLWSKVITEEVITKGIEITIRALGVIVGFAWEQSFDLAVDAVAMKTEESTDNHWKLLTKVGLGVSCIIIVAPAWRMYLQPMVTHDGWRFGFVTHRVIETAKELMISLDDPRAKENLKEYRKVLHQLQILLHKAGDVPEPRKSVTCEVFDGGYDAFKAQQSPSNPPTTELSNTRGSTSHDGSAA